MFFFRTKKEKAEKRKSIKKRNHPLRAAVYYPISGNLAPNRFPLSTKISMSSEACT
jgi:hypothetical protein